MNRKIAIAAALIVAAGMFSFAGCGPARPETAPVSGRVTYRGKPVVEGTITFQPEQGRPAVGSIAADGSYTLTCFERGDGALLGRHRVTIESRRITDPRATAKIDPMTPVEVIVEWLVPEKYSRFETSPLSAEVEPGQNVIDFDLPADPGRPSP